MLLALLSLATLTVRGGAHGVPFIRSYDAEEYAAHNRNYDIVCDSYGSVFVANFEGLLYYDGATWRKIHTPGISRVTCLAKASDGTVWVGGYNVFGYLKADARGCLQLHTIISDTSERRFGEVDKIVIHENKIYVHTSTSKSYRLLNGKTFREIPQRLSDEIERHAGTVEAIRLGSTTLAVSEGKGLTLQQNGRSTMITDRDGLCSTNITALVYDNLHSVWGATEHGLFTVEMPSPFTCLTDAQGLKGEVYSIGTIGETVFFGTMQGLYRLQQGTLAPVPGMSLACWQLHRLNDNTLLAATATGLYRITQQATHKLTDGNTLSVAIGNAGRYYTGEMDGVYEVSEGGQRRMIANVEKCTALKSDGQKLHAVTLYGEQWDIELGTRPRATHLSGGVSVNTPKIDFTDMTGRRWFTDSEGKKLQVHANGKADKAMNAWMVPIAGRILNAACVGDGKSLWIGGDFGAICYDLRALNSGTNNIRKEPLYIRQVVAFGDSVLWGGYDSVAMKPLTKIDNIELPSSCHSFTVYFSTATSSVFHPVKYRFRLNKGRWSTWTEETNATFNNMQYGPALLEVQALDPFGNVSNTAEVRWLLNYPFYMRWWAVLFYALVVAMIVRYVALYRMKKLQRDKMILEQTVNERTAALSTALDDLQRTQADLVRMERTATAGKLTQGLIDRILNPINYINNFSKLTSGLAKDLHEDIQDDKENMTEDIYDDCEDIIEMMTTNLGKIEEHGINTTRTLRAMEAMLKNQIGPLREADLTALCRHVIKVTAEYHKQAIADCSITLHGELPDEPLLREIDQESLGRSLIAMLTNAVYAVTKKYSRQPYAAEVLLKMTQKDDKHIEIVIHDNGVGVEETIVDKVFDPFFTTKPTSEGSGVGLYLARETVQDHNGTITLRSEKDVYTDFIITL